MKDPNAPINAVYFIDIGYGWGLNFNSNKRQTSTIIRSGTILEPNEKLTINLDYSSTETKHPDRQNGKSSESRYELRAFYVPFTTVSLVARISVADRQESKTTLHNYSCSSAASGTILVNADNSSEKTYKAIAYLTLDGEQEYVDSLYHKFYDTTDHFGKQGVFIVLILTMVLVFVGWWSPSVAVMLVPLGLFIGYLLGIVRIPLTAIIGIFGAAVVVVYAIQKKS